MRHGTSPAPVFHPSVEEFRDPVAYIRSIRSKAEPFGLCKIVPPCQATTLCFEALRRDAGHTGNILNLKLTSRQQLIGDKEWEDWNEDRVWGAPERSLKAFHQAADATATKVFGTCLMLPHRRVEGEFWQRMGKPTKANASSFYVEHGENTTGSGFLDVEDLYLLSLNFHHIGAPKTWYAVAAQHADDFEKAIQEKAYARMCSKLRERGASEDEVRQKVLETLARKTTVMSPQHLSDRHIPITRTEQAAGEFVVTFARTYHLAFSHGVNLSECINFALTEWYEHGTDAALRLTFLRKPPALPVEQMACVDMLTLAESLKGVAEASDCHDFRAWLLGPGSSAVATTHVSLLVSFCRLIRWYHRNISKFLADGLTMHRQAIDISVPCCASGELMHVAAIMPQTSSEPISLRHCLLVTSKDPSAVCKGVLLLHEKWEVYQELAQIFGELCLQQGWGGTDTKEWRKRGLTDRLHIPTGKNAPCWEDLTAPYSWQLDDSSPLHSAWSSNEFLPRASDKDGMLLPVFEAVYPDAAADVPVVAAPSKTTACAKRSSSKGGKGAKRGGKGAKEAAGQAARAQTPEIAEGEPSPHATTAKSLGQGTPADATPAVCPLGEADAPRKRASRASKNAAMASWKANKMLDEDDDADDDSRSEDGTRQSRRSKKMKRDESMGALQAAKTGPGLAKVYSNATSVMPQDCQGDRLQGKDGSGDSPLPNASGARPSGSAGMPLSDLPPNSHGGGSHAPLALQGQQSLQQHVPQQQQAAQQQQQQHHQVQQAQMPQQQLGQQGQAWSGGAGGAGRPRSQSLSPITNYNAFHAEQDRWRRNVSEVNNQWVQKLQECAKTNADVQNLLRYYMSLPDVSHVYPVSADARSMGPIAPSATAASGGAPSAGMPGGNGAASVGGLQNGSGALQGSGALSASTLPLQQAGSAQRRPLQGQAMNAWPPNSARKESLHNGPISAQDLATSIRGRPASSDDSRQNGGKGRGVMGAPSMQAPGVNPTAATSVVPGTAGGNSPNAPGAPSPTDGRGRNMPGGHRSSATNLPTTDPGSVSLAPEQSASHMSPSIPMQQPGGAMPSLGMNVMDGQPQSPMLPLTPHSPGGTPRSGLDDIINGTRNSDFHDFLSSLGGDHDDVDLGMEF